MSFRVQLAFGAARDLQDICRYLDRNSVVHADHLLDRLDEAFEGLASFPLRGRYPKELADLGILEYRELLVTSYRVIYRGHTDQVLVLIIADGRRDMQALLERPQLQPWYRQNVPEHG